MLTRLYRLIWQLLHLLLCAHEILRGLRAALQRSYDQLCGGRAKRRRKQLECANLKRSLYQLEKLPQHIAIIVGPDDKRLDEETLADMFTYALVMEVNCISYYDTRPPDKGHISLEKFRAPKGMQCKPLNQNRYLWQMDIDTCTNSKSNNGAAANGINCVGNGVPNGNSKPRNLNNKALKIFEITKHDGRPLIADVCRCLFELCHSAGDGGNKTGTEPIHKNDVFEQLFSNRAQLTERINDELSQRLGDFTEPELGIIFSRCMCTYGMLPWHTRFTEFHTIETGCAFSAKEFSKILHKYSRCEQRWGR